MSKDTHTLIKLQRAKDESDWSELPSDLEILLEKYD